MVMEPKQARHNPPVLKTKKRQSLIGSWIRESKIALFIWYNRGVATDVIKSVVMGSII